LKDYWDIHSEEAIENRQEAVQLFSVAQNEEIARREILPSQDQPKLRTFHINLSRVANSIS
jgi:hypothetical protein